MFRWRVLPERPVALSVMHVSVCSRRPTQRQVAAALPAAMSFFRGVLRLQETIIPHEAVQAKTRVFALFVPGGIFQEPIPSRAKYSRVSLSACHLCWTTVPWAPPAFSNAFKSTKGSFRTSSSVLGIQVVAGAIWELFSASALAFILDLDAFVSDLRLGPVIWVAAGAVSEGPLSEGPHGPAGGRS